MTPGGSTRPVKAKICTRSLTHVFDTSVERMTSRLLTCHPPFPAKALMARSFFSMVAPCSLFGIVRAFNRLVDGRLSMVSRISKRSGPTPLEYGATVSRGSEALIAIRRMVVLALSLFSLMTQGGYGQDVRSATSSLTGTVFVGDPGSESYIPEAKVFISGPTMAITETDQEGKYTFDNVPPGTYTVEASFETLKGELSIKLESNQLVELPIQLIITEVKTSVTVTATDSTSASPAPAEIINEKTVIDAPNADEQFQGLLPLVPGVVRGPDGLVNLKGTRNTQSGALVNNANVTDPATGSPAFSLPIDVVSSVKVISNPYDPEYGKLTGAVSDVETKTGDFDGYHFSIQNILPRPRYRDGSFVGIESATPRMTFTGPLVKDRVALRSRLSTDLSAPQ